MAQLPPGLTSAPHKAALAKVIMAGRERIDRARQAAKAHLESARELQVGAKQGQGGGDDS
jgi:hypothetical protein